LTAPARFWRRERDGLAVRVRLTPRGGQDALEGVEVLADGVAVLKARVRAAPEKGLANSALEKLIATGFGVAKSSVSVVAGGTSRTKTLKVLGEPERLIKVAETLAGA
jgi:uncharacterized protein YggU (UPF0235/DUF167 family)